VIRGAVVLAALAACRDRAPISSCSDDLTGIYVIDGKRWDLTAGAPGSYEAFPQFDDGAVLPGAIVAAPRVIDLARTPTGVSGHVRRRYMRGSDRCDTRSPARITACSNDELQLVITDPVPPLGYAPCSFGRADSSRVERWRRER
jgi:hypothetical protein